MSTLTQSQIATLRNVNERPGISVFTIGQDYATALQAAGMVEVRKGKVYPTPAAAPYQGRTPAQVRAGEEEARATLIGRWGALR